MSSLSPPSLGPSEAAVDQTGKRTLLILATFCPLIFWAALAQLIIVVNGYFSPPGCLSFQPPDGVPILGLIAVLFAGVPYLHLIWRLRGPNDPINARRRSAFAITTGMAGLFILPAALLFAGPSSLGTDKVAAAALLVMAQALLIGFGVRAFRALPNAAVRASAILSGAITPLVYFLVFIPIFFMANLELFPPRRPMTDNSPVVTLMVAGVEEHDYAQKNNGSFSPSLDFLGSAFQPKLRGYRFVYAPGAPSSGGKITTYTLSAIPAAPCPSHCSCSYFTNQTGILRMTTENRPATVHDPPLTHDQRSGRGAWPQM